MTPDRISQDMIDGNEYQGLIIEPSFGLGSFLYKLEKKYITIGVEFDKELYSQYQGSSKVFNQSFYQFAIPHKDFTSISFIGNPPYRTPALSLTSEDRSVVKALSKKYRLTGSKEEAVFFIAHAVDLIEQAQVPGIIHWVLPKTIFENNSKAFRNFRAFLDKHAPLIELIDINGKYPDVAQPLCIAKFAVNQPVSHSITHDFVLKDTITFKEIFKKTYLGSIPCEGILMSCRNEPLNSFMNRMEMIFQHNQSLEQGLKYNNHYHLRALNNGNQEKFAILCEYIREIKQTIDVKDFSNRDYYKPIQHRTEQRWYFRHYGLTKVSFIYIINSNPTKSFYFPGNPSRSSTDYFGFCEYDCNRNSSPGANRTIPIENIRDNITDEFKTYWAANTNEPIEEIFNYILYISKSEWYKEYKNKHQRFYFGLPKQFNKKWTATL
jgi:hypothetical protein